MCYNNNNQNYHATYYSICWGKIDEEIDENNSGKISFYRNDTFKIDLKIYNLLSNE